MITIRGINGDILTHFDNDVPNGNPYFEPVLTDDMESLVSSFSFSVPLELADTEHLVGLNQVLVKDRQGDLRLFVITDVHEVWTTVGGTLQVNCEDISINEMNNIIVNPFNGISFNDTLYKTFEGSGWKLKYGANWEDVDNTTMVLENYDNMRSVIASIVDTYGCQFKFMAQENQFGEITRVAEVYKSRGNDTGKYFYYDRDLLGIERDINHADIKTAIHPYYTGYDGKTYSLKGFAPANPDPDFKKDKASPLIINREASKLFDDGNSYRIMPYKTEVEGNPELVYREAIKELKKYAEPIYTYSVNVLLLQNMIGWEGEDIDLGDTVWMKERVGNRELGLEARVTAYEYHEDDPSKDVVTFSNFKEIDTTDVPELAERIFIAYANSADGIIDFSITDSVGKAYMGVYTAAVSTQSTDPSTYSWTRIKGEDGASAPTLNLTSSQQVMKFKSDGTPDGDQTVIFTALKQNSTETVTWEAIPYKGDAAQPVITLGGTGDVRSLTSADWNSEWTRVQVTVSMGSLKDIQTIVMVSDGATGASGKAIVGYVTNESTTFAASSDGTVADYDNGSGKFVLYEGTNEVTSGITFARVSQVGINLLINDTTGEYKVSNMTTDMAQASVSATYKGVTITKFLSFSKSKQGAKGDKGDTGNDGIAGKDGIGLKSTTVTYAASASGTTAPSTGWQEQVPTVAPSNFLWTRTVWAYTDDTSETGYSVAKMGKDGAKGDDGIAGKDGVGIKDTLIEYAVSASGTTRPTSGWSTTIPTVPQGQYLWTRTTWTYTDNTTEQGFTVARQGEKGDKGDQGIAGPKGADGKTQYTHIAYADDANGGGFSQSPTGKAYIGMYVDFEELDSSDPTKYAWSLIKGADGEQGIAGPKGEDGLTPYFHTAYINSTDFGTYDYSGNPNIAPLINDDNVKTLNNAMTTVTNHGTYATAEKIGNDLTVGIGMVPWSRYDFMPLTVGKQYALTIPIRINADYTGDISKLFIRIRCLNADGSVLVNTKLLPANTPKGELVNISTSFTVPTTVQKSSSWYCQVGSSGDYESRGTVDIGYAIKLEEGSTATPYQPNLLDAPYYFSKVALEENIANKDTQFPIKSSEYLLYKADMEEEYILGQTYTVTIKGTKPASQTFVVYNDGTINFGNLKPVEGLTDVWSLTFTPTKISPSHLKEFRIFQYPSSTVGACQIDWIKIEKGDTRTPNIDYYKYLGNYTDFEQADSLNPTKYSWSLIKGVDGEDGRTPYFHTAYTNDTDFGTYDYSGNPNLMRVIKASDFKIESDAAVSDLGYNSIRITSQGTNRLSVFTLNNIPSLVSGKTYAMSVTIKFEEGTTGDIDKLRVSYRKANGGTILLTADTKDAEVGKEITIKATGTINYEITDLSKFYLTIDTLVGAKINGSVIVSNIKIEEGSTTTPYQPNLLDAPYYLSKVALGENIADPTKVFPYIFSSYNIYLGKNTEKYQLNQTYTITMKATKPSTQQFGVYLLGGSMGVGNMEPVEGLTDVWKLTFKVTQAHLDAGVSDLLSIYQLPQSTIGKVTIDWIKLEKGDTRTPNIDSYNYLGSYTDFDQEGSLNPTKYSWSLIKGADGNDGAPAKALTLQADSPVMKFDANDVVVAGQVITFTAVKQNIDSNIAWVATPYKGSTAQPAIALKGTGDVRTLEASMWASGVTTVRVEVSADSFRDFVTITKVKDGAKGDKGNDGIAGKDGVGIRSTAITYAGSASGTTPPTTGWQTQVPTVPAGQFLWTKTVWTYTDNSTETGYSAAMMGKDGAKGNDGIAGKDGVGIKTTVIEYAVNTSGTVKPTSGWTSAVPNVPQGQYLWTRTTWTYTDNTTEQGFTVARQGNNGQNGSDGIDAYSAILTNEANTFAANPAGAVTDWSTGNGTFMVYRGTTRLTSGVAYAIASSVYATGTINATTGDYTVTSLGRDNGSITFKATIGSTVLTKTMSLSKARQGVQGVQGTMGIAFYSPTEPTGDNVTEGSTWFKTVSAADDTIAGIYTYKGGNWIKTEVASGALSVEKLSALSADLGDVTAGTVTGIDIIGSGFTNPFDFQDVSGNHLEGSTTIESAQVVIDGVTNRGTLGERKFNTSVNPQFFQTVYRDSSDSILTSMNVSPTGLILNNPVALRTVTVSDNALQILDNTKGTSTWANTNSIGIAQGGSSERAEMGLGGFLYKNRKNVHIWTGTGDQTNSTPNNARLRFGPYVSYGWGISASDNPFRLVQPYIWQVDREIKFEWIIQVSLQDATSDYVYFKMYFKDTQDTDQSPQAAIHSGRISSANNNSSGVNLRMQNTVFLHGYHKASANQYFSLVTECRTGRNCGNVRILSSAFREMFEE